MAGPEGRKERKVVTVLFADLVGFTSRAEPLDPEDVAAILEPYHARLRAELERFAGTVEKFIGDAVMALFGAPVAHEDDAERAVRAALAIRDWARGEGVEVRVAVNTGQALVRVDARPEAGEGMAAGDVVNTAARLQAAAPVGGILVGEATYRATREVIDYRDAEPVTAKGKAEPVPVWQAVRARAPIGGEVSRSHATPLVSREHELNELRIALARACQDRSSQLVTLVGIPGIGKSRLVHELMHSTAVKGVTWRRGRSLPYGAGVSFWALAEMVKAQAGIHETDGPDVAEQKVHQAVAGIVTDERDLPWIERHLQPLVGLGSDTPAGGDRRAESFAAWRRFVALLATVRPLVLIFEDLHWADDDLLDFVESLTEWLTDVPLLVLCTARPELLDRRPAWSTGKPGALTLSIAPLSDGETATLITKLVERAILPAETQAAILAHAGGNPLFAEQYVWMLVERGDAEGVPESVQGIIAARLDALSPEDKDLLQSAAVIGHVFWPGAVAAITGGDRWTVGERLHGLERRELVRGTADSSFAGETGYAFAHILVRDVAYGQIPRGQRAEKHRLAAEWIESLGRPEDHAELLAHHYSSALEYARAAGQSTDGLDERARETLRDAGDRSFALNAYTSAARSYAAARDLWLEGDVERGRLAFLLGRARFYADESGADDLAEASELLASAGEVETAAEAEVLLADLSHRHAALDLATAHLDRARAFVEHRPASAAKARVAAAMARSAMLAGNLKAAIALGREALGVAEELGIDEVRASALDTIGNSRVWSGDSGGAEDMERSAVLAAEIASGSELVRAMGNLMVWTIARGDVRGTAELGREVLETAERFGQAPALRWYRSARLTPAYWRGDWDQAIALADQFILEVEADAPHYNAMQFYAYRGQIRLARDDIAGALHDAENAVAVARAVKDTQQLPRALGLSAFAFAEAGVVDRASPLVEEAIAALAAGIELLLAVVGLPALAEAARLLGRSAGLRDALGERYGWSRWADAARAIARDDFIRAAEICAMIGSLPDEALCRLRAAERLVDEGRQSEADEQLARALPFYRTVGAMRFIRKAEGLVAI